MKRLILTTIIFNLLILTISRADDDTVSLNKTFNLTPTMTVQLPNGVVEVVLNQTIDRTLINYLSKYDFLDNYMESSLDLRYTFPIVFIGTNLSDRTDFEAIYLK